MRTFRLILLGLLLVAVPACLLIAGGWWWLNSYVKTDEFRKKMETHLSQVTQGPVQIDRVTFDFFNGVELQKVSCSSTHLSFNESVDITILRVDCAYSWRNLLHGKLSLTKLTLQKPQIVLHSFIPTPVPASEVIAPVPPPAEISATSPAPSSSGNEASQVSSSSEQDSPTVPLHFTLHEVHIENGNVTFQNQENKPFVSLQKIQLQINTKKLNQDQVNGTIHLGEVDLQPAWKIFNFSTPFIYQHGAVQAQPFTASVFNGNLAGDYTLSPPLPSTLNLNMKGSDLNLITSTFAPHLQLTGTLDLQSKWRALETTRLDGEGDVQVENGQISGIPILQEISNALRIKELAAPTFTESASHFTLMDQHLRLTSLDVEGDFFSLTGDGTLNLSKDKDIAFNFVLMLRKEAMDQLPRLAASSFIKKEDGTGSISFQVTGTLNQPSTDLPNRLLTQNTELQNVLSNALESFFHKNEKKSEQNQPTQPPSVTAPVLTNSFPALTVPAITNAPSVSLPLSPATNNAPDGSASGTAN